MSPLRRISSRLPGQSSADSDVRIDEDVSEDLKLDRKLLHGALRVTICKPERLDGTTGRRGRRGGLFSQNFKKKAGLGVDLGVGLGIAEFNTTVGWDVPFQFHCAHMVSNITITLEYYGTSIGTKDVPVEKVLNGQETETRFEIDGLEIVVKLQYLNVKEDHNRDQCIGSTEFSGVPNTCFPQRQGCKVFLYQDAHVPDDFNPEITLANDQPYQPKSCWQDVFNAINGAKHIICITGWSVYTEISLIRDPRRPEHEKCTTLGELLKKKADEGVRVLMLVWHDRTAILSYKGVMATHANETMQFFSGTRVQCVLCSPQDVRWTHHQKTVVVDSELPSGGLGKRGIVSFVGGIDLCDGRYDTPSHSLFRTLNTVHHDDFHQPSISGAEIRKGGPREPWHDIHARLEGPIAWDVLENFEQRWRKQGKKDDLLKELEGIIIDTRKFPLNDHDHETWRVQLFRSIDSGSAFGLPNSPKVAPGFGLVGGKNKIIDRSIQDAYISAIRRAKNFIYIESQYFLGSSFAWNSDDTGLKSTALHLIPKELSLKIVRKIEAGERFTVYVVVPMWPEGIPKGSTVQEILFYQKKTMEMMYKDVIRALKAKGSREDPQNYLAFFCLGNREKKEREYQPRRRPRRNSHYMRAQEAQRFMIYVHSKMMIVDDEYIIVGSANINQRSMDGARDTEIAFGGYEPRHLATTTSDPARGQIYRFRMSLWYEHLGRLEPCFEQPQHEVCIKRVNELAKENWDAYSSGSGSPESDLPGHLLRYPVGITEDGAITELEGFKFFPDTKASVVGKQSRWSRWAPKPVRSARYQMLCSGEEFEGFKWPTSIPSNFEQEFAGGERSEAEKPIMP